MTPQPAHSRLAARAERRKRLERVSFAVNGALFFVGAWDALDTHGPVWSVALSTGLGLAQVGALVASRGKPLPWRLPYALAAFGMFANALAVVHHKTGLPYAYLFAGLVNVFFAVVPSETFRGWFRRPAPTEP